MSSPMTLESSIGGLSITESDASFHTAAEEHPSLPASASSDILSTVITSDTFLPPAQRMPSEYIFPHHRPPTPRTIPYLHGGSFYVNVMMMHLMEHVLFLPERIDLEIALFAIQVLLNRRKNGVSEKAASVAVIFVFSFAFGLAISVFYIARFFLNRTFRDVYAVSAGRCTRGQCKVGEVEVGRRAQDILRLEVAEVDRPIVAWCCTSSRSWIIVATIDTLLGDGGDQLMTETEVEDKRHTVVITGHAVTNYLELHHSQKDERTESSRAAAPITRPRDTRATLKERTACLSRNSHESQSQLEFKSQPKCIVTLEVIVQRSLEQINIKAEPFKHMVLCAGTACGLYDKMVKGILPILLLAVRRGAVNGKRRQGFPSIPKLFGPSPTSQPFRQVVHDTFPAKYRPRRKFLEASAASPSHVKQLRDHTKRARTPTPS
ncbi:hypothetical protein BV25DRAFT_1842779 [Artomyces pyxidatus]|uniref:Uncharacterized protein n=1 Tax=Artomyces pyxidatus TaxID=48021 RepID=A0ACB8SGQ0_9AGAM|nr:hypothetical protein BV25DRAFT_1842779 [Artomyces pyxidatus]